MKLVDTHAHIYDKQFKPDFDEIIDKNLAIINIILGISKLEFFL